MELSLEGGAYFEICSLEPVIYTFAVTFCQGNMNTVREMSGKCQGILKKTVAMNPEGAVRVASNGVDIITCTMLYYI